MEGDFTRNSDDPAASYSGVLMQQGRVQLDADWNEQWAIQMRALRAALRDIIGDHGGPASQLGFTITSQDQTLTIGEGVYYVDGIRCLARTDERPISMTKRVGTYLVFLDVWERHVNAIEAPRTREVALLGPDTATRAEVIWRVRLLRCTTAVPQDKGAGAAADKLVATQLRQRPRRKLAARANTEDPSDDPCKLSPLAQYRGRENQLYRVEIHDAQAGALPGGDESETSNDALFTFKWSRDNGSVVFPIVSVTAPEPAATATVGDGEIVVTVQLGHLGRDERFGLEAGHIVEFVHDALTRGMLDPIGFDVIDEGGRDPGRPGLLGRVLAPIDRDSLTVRVAVYADDIAEIAEGTLHPYLRRWDQRNTAKRKLRRGTIPVTASDLGTWLALEDGVEIKFEGPANAPLEQRSGDYWQIPARVATGNVIWPQNRVGTPPKDTPALVPPHGPYHHYAPLAFVFLASTGNKVVRVRRSFPALAATSESP